MKIDNFYNFLQLIRDKHEQEMREKIQQTDYLFLNTKKWSFAAFIQCLAYLMGKKGGMSSFTPNDYEILKMIYESYPQLNETILTNAWKKISEKSISQLTRQIKKLFSRKEK